MASGSKERFPEKNRSAFSARFPITLFRSQLSEPEQVHELNGIPRREGVIVRRFFPHQQVFLLVTCHVESAVFHYPQNVFPGLHPI
jgi:hypothetical protein